MSLLSGTSVTVPWMPMPPLTVSNVHLTAPVLRSSAYSVAFQLPM